MLQNKTTQIRTFQVVANVSSFLEGEIQDWPANIQDGILAALERKAQEVELPLTVVASYCDLDYATEEGEEDKPFVVVIASEIVAADSRFVQIKSEVDQAVAKIMKDLRDRKKLIS